MHAVAILVAIEAVLVAAIHLLTGGRWHRTCAYLLAVTAPLELYRTTVHDVHASLFRLSIAVVAATVVIDVVRSRRWSVPELRAAWPLVGAYLFLALVVAGSWIGGESGSFLGRRLLAVLVMGVIVIVLVAELGRRISAESLAGAVVVGSILPILASCWQVVGPKVGGSAASPFLEQLPVGEGVEATRVNPKLTPDEVTSEAIRLKGTFGDANHFASYLVFVIALAAALSVRSSRRGQRSQSIAYGGIAAAGATTLVGTYSRSAWAAIAMTAAATLVLLGPSIRPAMSARRIAIAGAAVAATGLILVLTVGSTVGERLTPGSALNATSNATHRANTEKGIDAFRSRPVFGIGAGRLGTGLNQNVRISAADSTYVTVAAELGAVGLFALLLAAGTALQLMWRACRRAGRSLDAVLPVGLLGAYAGLLLINVVYDDWWKDFHFVLLGLISVVGAQAAGVAAGSRAGSSAQGRGRPLPPQPA